MQDHYKRALFVGPKLADFLRSHHLTLQWRVNQLTELHLVQNEPEKSVNQLVDDFTVACPVLDEEKIEVIEEGDELITKDDFGTPVEVRHRYYIVSIPFSGEEKIFNLKPAQDNYHRATGRVDEGDVQTAVVLSPEAQRGDPNPHFRDAINRIKIHLGFAAMEIDAYNRNLRGVVQALVRERKQKLDSDVRVRSQITLPFRKRGDAPLRVPLVRKAIPVSKPENAEPYLREEDYESVLKTLSDMSLVMERNPHVFHHLDEEALTTHFLVPLNAQYEGAATNETFSMAGKTDIQIKYEGKTVFIAESKFWEGPAKLLSAVDQLLGYTSWRDTKTAILLFNRNKNLSKVLEQIEPAMKDHPCCEKSIPRPSETQFQFVFKSKQDPDRKLLLTVLVFDIPQPA